MSAVCVGSADELKEAGRKVFDLEGTEIGVFHHEGAFYAWHNNCPHQGGPVCQGRLFRLVEEEVEANRETRGRRYHESRVNIVCPWHGIEYDVKTGQFPGNPAMALTPAKVYVENGEVFLDV